MIKLLYIYIGAGKRNSSVKDKIIQIIDQFNKLGVNTHGRFFTNEVENPETLNEFVELIPVPKVSVKYFKSYHQHKVSIETVFEFISSVEKDYDVIYFRYPGANETLFKGMQKYGDKIVFEHNSKELNELELLNRSSKFGLNPSKFLTWYQNKKLMYANEKKWASKILPLAKMGLAVTDDIAAYERKRAKGNYNCDTSPNGIQVASVKHRKFVPYENGQLNVALISGANTAAPYLGVDRIINGLLNYKGDVEIKLFCVGKIFAKEVNLRKDLDKLKSIEILGELNSEGLNDFFDKIHLSLGSMGLHRIDMKEGSVMKVNDSLSRGIPVALAYDDMELKGCPEYKPYIFTAPADETPLNFDEIVSFAENLLKDEKHSDKIRSLALKHTDLSAKVSRVIDKINQGFGLEKIV
ncbi:MAG: hypothetical protein ACI8XB_000549 [Patiriisocius sp.]|jgi:hypothetical protein